VTNTSLGPQPLGVYLVPDSSTPLTTVSVWVRSGIYWGQPTVTATTTGTWTFANGKSATLPNTGWVTLPINTVSLGPWAAGYILADGTVRSASGRMGFTVSHVSTSGLYTINLGAAHPSGSNYGIVVSAVGSNAGANPTANAASPEPSILWGIHL
jgi:hypothetical protein